MAQGSSTEEGYWRQAYADGVTILASESWKQVGEAIGAGSGWMCRDQVRREIGSGRCVGWWVGGVRDARGGTLGAVVGIVNGEAGEGTLGASEGGTLEAAVVITLECFYGMGETTLGSVADVGTSGEGSSEWGG